ncbi:triple gene block protein 1 [Euonymus yellow mottle associated virus]|uniref:Triple gene block protein 1 n=1 Tax=Euonymus yellow mottle associated virus TaxID=2586645 RepID=A0A4Y5R5B9_9VIRU|nr:triple gene block protein 1 [Euonymus yellow mottle associated virus]QCY52825.1 triple gene block protein 1 [Euonymus yellow mottle associated virus]
MDKFVSLLTEFEFQRTREPISSDRPLVIHGVAGCGKSTLVLKFLRLEPSASAFTSAKESARNLLGRQIEPITSLPAEIPNDRILLLDEYPKANLRDPWNLKSFQVLLCDPLQFQEQVLPAHYISNVSKRFGKNTCDLLKAKLDITCSSSRFDSVTEASCYEVDPEGHVIGLDTDICHLARQHSLSTDDPTNCLGQTYPTVTVLSCEASLKHVPQHLAYIALTRHRTKLIILSPNYEPLKSEHASDSST